MDWLPSPAPPSWATNALPSLTARKRETFCAYTQRIGFDCEQLAQGLEPRTAAIANLRLATAIARSMPEHFSQHVRALFLAHNPPERLEHVRRTARLLHLK